MKKPQIITDLLNKPMNRKQFLGYIGAGSLFLMGGGFVLNSLANMVTKSNSLPQEVASSQSTSYGYGLDVYGGRA